MDIDQLIQKIVSHAVTEGKKTVLEQLYRDEKILKPASKLPRYLPEVYRQMAALATDREAIFRSEAWIFCRQGQFMAEHTEEEGDLQTPFFCFFPTYRLMNPAQLRAYFTWRTKLRQGICEPVSTSYAFVYIYELLNQIGVADPADGFEKLRRFRENYAPIDPRVERYLTTWMRDYRIYYGLLPDESAAEDDGALTALMHAADTPDDTLFSAICRFSSYDFCRSRAYKAHPKECAALLCRVYRDFAAFCDAHRKRSLFDRLFGAKVKMSYPMFRSAVFWERGSQPDRTVKCGEREEYTCKNGLWSRTGYIDKPDKNREEHEIISYIEKNSVSENTICEYKTKAGKYIFAKYTEYMPGEGYQVYIMYINLNRILNYTKSINYILLFFFAAVSGVMSVPGYILAKKIELSQETQRKFFQNTSHELKTPLMTVQGYAEGLQTGVTEPKQAAEVILQESDRMAQIVNELLSLSKIDLHSLKPVMTRTDIREVLYDSIRTCEPLMKQRGINIVPILPESPVYINGDEDMLERVFTNILSNAVRHCKTEVKITCTPYSRFVMIKFHDDGDGIAEIGAADIDCSVIERRNG